MSIVAGSIGDQVLKNNDTAMKRFNMMDLGWDIVLARRQEKEKVGALLPIRGGADKVTLSVLTKKGAKLEEEGAKLEKRLDFFNKAKSKIPLVAISLIAIAILGSWLLSVGTILFGVTVLALTCPSFIIAFFYWAKTSSDAKKTKAHYKALTIQLGTQHLFLMKKMIAKVVSKVTEGKGITGHIQQIVNDQEKIQQAWKEMQDLEIQPVKCRKWFQKNRQEFIVLANRLRSNDQARAEFWKGFDPSKKSSSGLVFKVKA